MTTARRSAPRVYRVSPIIILAAFAVLVVPLAMDVARHGALQPAPAPFVAQSLEEVAARIGRVRAINPIIVSAARAAVGDRATLQLPTEYRTLLALETDEFEGEQTITLNPGLMAPFIAGRVKTVAYDPILPREVAAAIERHERSVGFPMDVWALPGPAGAGLTAEPARLYTDPTRTRVYVLGPGALEEVSR
ncbi:MAG: hypothetical protein JXP72_06500 [Coriobacteriia bacterium]|nr:hypothetical protein [Coriobacteriia bacterium]